MQISSEIINILEYLGNKFGIVIDWTSGNVLPYLEQLCEKFINYKIATSIIWMILAIVLCVPCPILFRQLNKHKDFGVEHCYCGDDNLGRTWAYIGVIILCIIVVTIIIAQVFSIVECTIFPEKVIYDYIHHALSCDVH